ncbi:MAG TPA: hypothetical protein VFW21_14175 [Mycobacterium sp.]|nr:hypothetical protein [Mycobacterium sp.]
MSIPQEPGSRNPDAEPDTVAADEMPEAQTEVFSAPGPIEPDPPPPAITGERRFTAPSGFDAGSTQIINRPPDPATEIMDIATGPIPTTKFAAPQSIPGRSGRRPKLGGAGRSRWGWVFAVILVLAALAAVAILVTMLLTRDSSQATHQPYPLSAADHPATRSC